MADAVNFTVRRKDALFRKLRNLVPAAADGATEASRLSAEAMAGYAREQVPVRTGKLRDSIAVTPPGGTPPAYSQGARSVPEGAYMVTAGNTRVRYAHLVEFGAKPHIAGGKFKGADHPGAPAQPFFWPSYRRMRKQMRTRASRAMRKAIKEALG